MDFQLIDYIVYGLQLLMDFQLMEFKLMGYMLMDLTECKKPPEYRPNIDHTALYRPNIDRKISLKNEYYRN